MAEESFQEKTEQATPRRREQARKKGQVARSQELNSAVVLLAALVGLYGLGGLMLETLSSFTVNTLERSYAFEINASSLRIHMIDWARTFFAAVGPIIIVVGTAAFAVSLGQVGFMVNEEALNPKIERLDPFKGAKRILSKRSLVELVKGLLKIGIVGYISYWVIAPEMPRIALLNDSGIGDTFRFLGYMVFKVGMYTALALLVMALFDYLYQRWEHEQSIKMTKQEVKEETKQTEGDPMIRMRIRALQRENARRRMMDEVPEADVVITNPTHYAIAVKYDLDEMSAPRVVAKGKNLIAQKIKEMAREAGVPLVENKPLAQTLFKAVEVGQEIPEDLYKAVAEILAYVFRLKGK